MVAKSHSNATIGINRSITVYVGKTLWYTNNVPPTVYISNEYRTPKRDNTYVCVVLSFQIKWPFSGIMHAFINSVSTFWWLIRLQPYVTVTEVSSLWTLNLWLNRLLLNRYRRHWCYKCIVTNNYLIVLKAAQNILW